MISGPAQFGSRLAAKTKLPPNAGRRDGSSCPQIFSGDLLPNKSCQVAREFAGN